MKRKAKDISFSIKSHKVDVILNNVTNFRARRNFNGDSEPVKAFEICRRTFYCPFLREGKLYICALPVVAHYCNSNFGTTIPHTGYIDIYSHHLTARKVLKFLDQPSEVCRFC
ncbi:radical SAM domain-containing protein, partial [Candidatus Thiomargarita nelsonii]